MKRILLLITSFLIILSVSGQSKKDLKKNKVRSFKQIHTGIENGKETTVDARLQKFEF